MVSIITCAHKEIPWFNLTILSVCLQRYQEWEWIILDNSENNFTKKYFDWFFNEGQGQSYPQCKEKIKVYWVYEQYKNVSISNGKIGTLYNDAIYLTSCSDNSFIVFLDYDDILNNQIVENIYNANMMYPNVDYMETYVGHMVYREKDDTFLEYSVSSDDNERKFYNLVKKTDRYHKLYGANSEFTELCNNIEKENMLSDSVDIINKDITISLIAKELQCSRFFGRKYFTPFSKANGPYIIKKGVFRDYINGFYDKSAIPDISSLYRVSFMLNSCIIKYCGFISILRYYKENDVIDNFSNYGEYLEDYNSKELVSRIEKDFEQRHDIYKSWTNKITPKIYDTIIVRDSNSLVADTKLQKKLKEFILKDSDTSGHLLKLSKLVSQCDSVVEFGVREGCTTCALASGYPKKMTSYDICELPTLKSVIDCIDLSITDFRFIVADDLMIDIDYTDILFIDTLHIYTQLYYELKKHSNKVKKYIIMHDTETYKTNDAYIYDHGEKQDIITEANWNEMYPTMPYIKGKHGLMNAVMDFLNENKEWEIKECVKYYNGLTILSRR